jgi:serine protease Do
MKKLDIKTTLFVKIIICMIVVLLTLIKCNYGSDNQNDDKAINTNHKQTQTESSANMSNHALKLQQNLTEVADRVIPSVVTISSDKLNINGEIYPDSDDLFLGSGVLITNEGHIITAGHLVRDTDQLYVYSNDDTEYQTQILGRDDESDIALLKISIKGEDELKPISLGDSDLVKPGDLVMAIGNPFGLKGSITLGLVSSPHRKPNFPGSISNPDLYYIQTDALITKGNSGGALVNLHGEVIGINVSVLGFGEAQSAGIGFAVPINYAKRVIQNINRNKKTVEVYTGIITADDITGFNKHHIIGIKDKYPIIVSVHRGSPAYESGIRKGDVLISVNGVEISNGDAFHNMISNFNPGDKLVLEIEKAGDRISRNVKVAKKPNDRPYHTDHFLGLLVGDNIGDYVGFDINEDAKGMVVVGMEEGSPAINSSIKEGEVITSIDYHQVSSMNDYNNLIKSLDRSKPLYLITIITYTHSVESGSRSIYIENKW